MRPGADSTAVCDVVLFHGPLDRGIATFLRRALADSHLHVFAVDRIERGDESLAGMRQALAACSAVVVLLTRSTLDSRNTAFAIGLAMGWNKPIHILFDGIDASEVPGYLRQFDVRSVSDIDEVVRTLAQPPRCAGLPN